MLERVKNASVCYIHLHRVRLENMVIYVVNVYH